ncbi:hypothetical protein Are01nite_72390 [Actinoplanes regularis]|nr:hypothetical protein Are01nite_72390 [Actinoplanes regularis]
MAEPDQRIGCLRFHMVKIDQARQGGRHVEPHPIVRVAGKGHHLRQRFPAVVITERGDNPAHDSRIGLVTKPGSQQRDRLIAEGPTSIRLFIAEFAQDLHTQFPLCGVAVADQRGGAVEDLLGRPPVQGDKRRPRRVTVVVFDLPPRQPK